MTDESTATEETQVVASSSPEQAQAAAADDFDKDRAMATIAKLRSFEKEAKAKLRRLDELEAIEQQRTEKDLSEAQRLQKELDKLTAQHAEAQATIRRATLLESARTAASKAGLAFHDGALNDALTLGAFDALEVGDDKAMAATVKTLANDRPYLLKPAAATADLDGARRGSTTKADEEASRRASLAQRWGFKQG